MSKRYLGGVITANSVTPTGSFQDSAAPGMWTSAQQLQLKAAGLWPLFGNANPSQFIENLFSTYLYTGNGSSVTINNGIDLAGKGGLVWTKSRSTAGYAHRLSDTARGIYQTLYTNATDAQTTETSYLTAFNSDGFALGSTNNLNSQTYASWTFREQPKFFDIVTWTGNGANRTIAHNLGSVPGCIIVKKTSEADNWFMQHRSLGATKYIALNDADIAYTNSQLWNNTEPTDSVFTIGTNDGVNGSGKTYVAYLFAHDAGGFGLSGNENVVSCGSFADSSSINVNLGYEPQWIMVKATTSAGAVWGMYDVMRRQSETGTSRLQPNASDAEQYMGQGLLVPTATGFKSSAINTGGGEQIIYIAIRRGPMAVPTLGTKVFKPAIRTGTSASATITGVGFAPDLVTSQDRGVIGAQPSWQDRLRGTNKNVRTNSIAAETSPTQTLMSFDMDGATLGTAVEWNYSGEPFVNYFFRRAPSFMDEVCYTGTGSAMTIAHNLAAVPELMIIKGRSALSNWKVYSSALGVANGIGLNMNDAGPAANNTANWNDTSPTSSNFSVGVDSELSGSGATYVAYLFATCAGVSKVGSYTGTGTTQAIACGFTTGARFVLIKRTDSTGDWYVWDSARGIVAGNDPYLLWNSNNPEVTGTDYVDTSAAGFEISSTAPAAINANGGSYIFLAIS